MSQWFRNLVRGVAALALMALVAWTVLVLGRPQRTVAADAAAAPAASGETYIGVKRCSACHFKEYMSWKKTGHAKAFTSMPPKYASNVECLKCHITAYGIPGGYRGAATPDLLAVACEACHGPGSKHEEVAKQFTNKKVLSEAEKKLVNTPIVRIKTNVCIGCHIVQAGHKEHPKYDKQ